MKKIVYRYLSLGVFAFALTTATAQNKNNDSSREQKLEQLKKDLNLSDAQVLKIKQIEDSYKDEKLELKRKMKEVRKKEFNEMDAVFTPEQKTKLKELRSKKIQNKKGAN
jgi:periplasmic protein CpxP/Spy